MKGGFFLAKPPKEITLLDILETMEGTLSIVDCVMAPEKCVHNNECTVRGIWHQLNDGIRELMRSITFEKILLEYNQDKTRNGEYDYCI